MAGPKLRASARCLERVAIIDLVGELDGLEEQTLNAAYDEAEGCGEPIAVMLNFGEVEYMNSKGIALIVGLLRRAGDAQRRLIAYALNAHYGEIFEITRLSDYIGVYPDEGEALAAATSEQ